MADIYITETQKVTTEDKVTIKDAKKRLLPCPICGAKAYLEKDVVDGFYFGYSVGCPRACMYDGIHGITENTPENKRLSIFYLNSAEECVEKWNERVRNYNND